MQVSDHLDSPTPVDTGVLCDGGGEVPTAGASFPYFEAGASYEFQACNATSDCGCAGPVFGLVCVSDINLNAWGEQFFQYEFYAGACERSCRVSTDCDRTDTTCVGGFCTINFCGGNGGDGNTCDAQGCGDGTCIQQNFDDYLIGYCQVASSDAGSCSTSESVTQAMPCDPGSLCMAGECEPVCFLSDESDAGQCAAGEECFSAANDQWGTTSTCTACPFSTGPCCLAYGSPCTSSADCCSGLNCPASTSTCQTCEANGSGCQTSDQCCSPGSTCQGGGICQ